MDCRRCEELLFEQLDNHLSAGAGEQVRDHLLGCDSCRALQAVLAGETADEIAQRPPDELLAGVLRSTAGEACERAALLLAEDSDVRSTAAGAPAPAGGPPPRVRDPLLAEHLAACADCTAVAGALARLRVELPRLAELDPGPGFVAAVMAATVMGHATDHPLPAGESALARRRLHRGADATGVRGSGVAAGWRGVVAAALARLAARPRLALEGAYAAAVVFLLVFGLPSQSVAELPARALGGIRSEATLVRGVAATGVDAALAYGAATWGETSERFDDWLAASPAAGASSAPGNLRAWAGALRDMAANIWSHLFAPFSDNLRSLWRSDSAAGQTPAAARSNPPNARS